ncbi:helix-turn-helix domain-containing protein [Nocardiopsis sp. NRRL B-16309]|uniref:helix-turn-helix domain-containing protein n=1 Tax=Nocardiopsis sp. NRRL B-16309 TaxID=1519494 RepID=UPI0006AE285B|nr:helix-turn-helix domain-containing protein [Nocardiopsis sp. NRRL B-16309]KOX13989.1 DNA-binding protein [Nocardiopsis sp. NRRL B-16309]
MARSSVLGSALRIEPNDEDRSAAAKVVSSAAGGSPHLVLRLSDDTEVRLPDSLLRVLLASAGELSEGHGVTVLSLDTVLTPAEVAELLGVSRPFVVRLLDEGRIPSERLPDSRHRVVRLVDVLEFRAAREKRRTGRRRIAEEVDSAELPY